jgi:cobalamin biosynthesis protein CobD/CbiB
MDMSELKSVWDNPKATILEKTIANALMTSLKKGSLYSIDTLLTRVYGKPKETSDVTMDQRIEVVFVNGKTIL